MNAPGKTMYDRLARYARELSDDSVLNFNGVSCECTFHTAQVIMDYGSRTEKHRPYLHLIGEVRQVKFPATVMPHLRGVDSLTFPKDAGLQADVFYKFNRKELADLVRRGYYEDSFELPDILYDNDFELPMSCNLMVVSSQKSGEPPIIFVGLNNSRSMEFTAESSGYELSSYFDYVPEPQPVVSVNDVEHSHDDVEFDVEMQDDLFDVDYNVPVVEEQPVDESVMGPAAEDDDAEIRRLMEQYSQIEANVDIRKNLTSADIERAIQVASGMSVEDLGVDVTEPVVEEVVATEFAFVSDSPVVDDSKETPVVDTSVPVVSVEDSVDEIDDVEGNESAEDVVDPVAVDDVVVESVTEQYDDDDDVPKSAAIAKRIAIVEDNQDANCDVERKALPSQFEDVANAAELEYAEDADFEDAL